MILIVVIDWTQRTVQCYKQYHTGYVKQVTISRKPFEINIY